MLKEKVFKILEKNFSKVNSQNELVSYRSILDADIHSSIKNYVKAELKILFSRDKSLIKKKSVFNYSSAKTEFIFHQLFDEIVKSTFISLEEVNNLFLQAISFNLSHLIKPNWSLKKIIFNEKKNISSSDFFHLIEYAYFFPYQKNIIIKYFRKFDYNSIESEKFEEVLKKIDDKLFSENKKEILLDFFNTSLDFTDTSYANKVEVEIILSYLSDKGLAEEFDKLKKYVEMNKVETISKSEFESILFHTSKNEFAEDKGNETNKNFVSLDKEENPEQLTQIEDISDIKNQTNKDQIVSENNLNENENYSLFDEEFEEELFNESENSISETQGEEVINKNSKNENQKSASDFLKYLTEKEILRIQENIFNSDSEDFVITIEKLISSKSYDDSLRILNEIVNSYHIDSDSKEINLLKSALQKFFEG